MFEKRICTDAGNTIAECARRDCRIIRRTVFVVAIAASLFSARSVHAFGVFDQSNLSNLGVMRWEAKPHFVEGVERSLHGGLRYSLEGGSYEAFRDQLRWNGTPPTVAEFQTAVEQAFAAPKNCAVSQPFNSSRAATVFEH